MTTPVRTGTILFDPLAHMVPDVIAHYRITSKIGEGGMGVVYRATDTQLGREVAIKIIPDVFVQDVDRMARFTREAHLLASLNHPNIATIHGIEPGAIVMELVAGQTLAEMIAGATGRAAPIPLTDALPIARQIAEALEYAHEHAVVHRDLKPANVKVTPEGQVKLLDFGLAKAMADDASAASLANSPTLTAQATRAGVILGTAAYMSPEQAIGKVVDRRADIWAFGAVLYEMLTGGRGFGGESVVETLAAVMKQEPDWTRLPAETPASIRRLLRRCLEKDPKRRLRDIGEARIALDEGNRGDTDIAEPLSSPSVPRSRRASVAWITAGTLGVALLATTTAILLRERPADLPALRSTILPPDQVAFNFSEEFQFGPMAISPDGRLLTFSARSPDGKILLWVRPLDSLKARELTGTEGGTYPFWSPDSQHIGFFANGKLTRIPAAGGNITPLADVTNGRGGTWNQNDVILFAPGYFTPILKVSARGGATTAVTTPDAARRETSNRFPWFLPDGRHFLYTAQDTTAFYQRSTIRLASLDSQDNRVLTDSDSNVVYAQGYLLYLRASSNTLVAQPFDAKTLATTAEPLTLIEGVRSVNITSCGVFSASTNGLLVYQAGAPETGMKLLWVDRNGKPITAVGDPIPNQLGSIHFSPDRNRLSVNIQSATSPGSDIWIQDMTRGLRTPFTSSAGVKRAGIWSPDGQIMVFDARREGQVGPQDLYRKPSDGGRSEELLYADDVNKQPTSWSPDGKSLLYTAGTGVTGYDVFVLPDPLGPAGPRKPISFLSSTRFNEQYAQFSPDGRWVAYASNESLRSEIWVTPFPGPGAKRQVSTAGGFIPRWRHDGKEILYVADRRMMAAEIAVRGDTLEVVKVQTLFDGGPQGTGAIPYDVSVDGQAFLIVSRGEQTATAPLTLVQNWTAGLGRK